MWWAGLWDGHHLGYRLHPWQHQDDQHWDPEGEKQASYKHSMVTYKQYDSTSLKRELLTLPVLNKGCTFTYSINGIRL